MGAGSVAKFLTNLGKKAFSEVDEFIGTAVKNAGQEIDEGLRYMQDQGALGDLLNRYYSNMNRGSKLTTRGQMQDTDLGKLKVNVGRVPLQETGRTLIKPDDVVGVEPLDLEELIRQDAAVIPTMWDRSDLGVLTRVNDEDLAFPVPLDAGYQYPMTRSNFDAIAMVQVIKALSQQS
jgi:hypothetical protein